MILQPSPVSTERFTWADGMFVTEASSLGDFRLGRVYDDACDVGFTLVSHRTGRKVVVSHVRDIRDGEGDLVASVFETAPYQAGAPSVAVHILND